MKANLNERVPPCLCPRCGQLLDAATDATLEGKYPSPGDFSVCLKCAAVLVFTDNFKLRLATSLELATFPKETVTELRMAVRVAKHLIDQGSRGH